MEMGDASDADSSFSDSESLWSHDEDEDPGSGSEFGEEEEGDTFLNDSDLWEDEDEASSKRTTTINPGAVAQDSTSSTLDSHNLDEQAPSSEASPTHPTEEGAGNGGDFLDELSRVMAGVDPDAEKKAEERFRAQQGVEARVRREGGYYLNAMKREYDARGLIQDEHCQKVLNKLAHLKPDPDGRYRNLMEVVSDTDVLLEAYRRVKAGPGGDPSKVPIHNVNMDWFRETQAKLRSGTFQLRPIKVVEVEKREISRLERQKRVFRRAYRKKRQPF